MALVKNRKEALSKYDIEKVFSLEEASQIMKDITNVKFEIDIFNQALLERLRVLRL